MSPHDLTTPSQPPSSPLTGSSPAATLHVYTYRDGLLARMAHDLRLSLEAITMQRTEDGQLQVTLTLDALRVEGIIDAHGQLDATALSPSQREQIMSHMREQVLRTAQHPTASWRGQAPGPLDAGRLSLAGQLELTGQTRALTLLASRQEAAGRWRGELVLTPSRWGVVPFKALGGALKIKDAVRVVWSADLAALDPTR